VWANEGRCFGIKNVVHDFDLITIMVFTYYFQIGE